MVDQMTSVRPLDIATDRLFQSLTFSVIDCVSIRRAISLDRSGLESAESVAKIGNRLRVLDLTNSKVRDAVNKAADAKLLFESAAATGY